MDRYYLSSLVAKAKGRSMVDEQHLREASGSSTSGGDVWGSWLAEFQLRLKHNLCLNVDLLDAFIWLLVKYFAQIWPLKDRKVHFDLHTNWLFKFVPNFTLVTVHCEPSGHILPTKSRQEIGMRLGNLWPVAIVSIGSRAATKAALCLSCCCCCCLGQFGSGLVSSRLFAYTYYSSLLAAS